MLPVETPTIDILVIDDHAVFAQSLAAALNGTPDMHVVGVAHSGTEAIEAARSLRPQIALLDYQIPDVSGNELIRAIAEVVPGVQIIVLTASVDERTVVAAMTAGCVGYVTKDQGLDDVLAAVRAVRSGQAVLPPHLLAHVLPGIAQAKSVSLTPRETQTLQLLAAGCNNDAIAETMYVSRNTVRNHVQNLMQKLGAHSRLEAVAVARDAGLIADGPRRAIPHRA
jgi:DNA-binding NarL/FixJ family response regulator